MKLKYHINKLTLYCLYKLFNARYKIYFWPTVDVHYGNWQRIRAAVCAECNVAIPPGGAQYSQYGIYADWFLCTKCYKGLHHKYGDFPWKGQS